MLAEPPAIPSLSGGFQAGKLRPGPGNRERGQAGPVSFLFSLSVTGSGELKISQFLL